MPHCGRCCDMKKLTLPDEVVYLVATVLLALAVAMLTAADFGISMIVAPAYIFSQKLGCITFGQSEYILQGALFIAFCLLMKRIKAVYFASFFSCLIYGAILDGWRAAVPLFNPDITAPGSMNLPLRLGMFVVGVVVTSFSIALFFKCYLYPQVYDFFVKGISARFGIDRTKFKMMFDASCLLVGCAMTLLLFGKFVGIGVGTVIMTVINGRLIGWCSAWLDKRVELKPLLPRLAENFKFN